MKNKPVMLNSFQHLLITLLYGAVLCLVLAGCENFMKGSDIKKDLERNISYNNAKDVIVSISCPQDMGTVFPKQTYQAKLNYEFEIQFVPNMVNYIIKDPATIFEAISRIDKTQSRADCVEFRVAEQSFEDQKLGLYRIYVKIVKYADDIEIRPNLIEVPYVKSVQPEYIKGYASANTPIYIQFSKNVEDSNVLDKMTMSLADGDETISKKFEAPVLGEDKTTVIIEPKPKELIKYIENDLQSSSVELYINLEDGIVFNQDDIELPLSDVGGKNFKLRYKAEMEEIAPIRTDFFITNYDENITVNSSFTGNKFSMESIDVDSFDENTILQNRSSGMIYIYGKYFDEGSGVRTVTVTEQRIKDKSGQNVSEQAIKTEPYTSQSENAVFADIGDGNTEFCITYKTQSEDGAILITVSVADACTNTDIKQNKTVVVIKDTGLVPEELKIANSSGDITHFSMELEKPFLVAGAEDEYVATTPLSLGVIYNDVKKYYDPQTIQIYAEYILNGTNKRVDFSVSERTQAVYYPGDDNGEYPIYGQVQYLSMNLSDFSDETFAGKTIRLIVKDELGNINYKDYTIPKKPVFSYAELYNDTQYRTYYHMYYSQNAPNDVLYLKDSTNFSEGNSLCFSKEREYTYYAQFCRDGFFGPKSESFTTIPADNSLPAIEGAVVSYSNKPNSDQTYVTVTIPQNSWNNYSSIYYFLYSQRIEFVKDTFSASYLMPTSYLYSGTYDISLFGEKSNGQRTKGASLSTEKLTGTEYDNCKPSLSHFAVNKYSHYYQAIKDDLLNGFDSIIACQAKDYGSGLDYVIIKSEGMEDGYRYNADDYLIKDFIADNKTYDLLLIPFWDMDDDEKINFNGAHDSSDSKGNYYPITRSNFTISAYDKAGNYMGSETTFTFHCINKPEVYSITNTSDSGATYSIKFSHTNDHSKMYEYVYKLAYDSGSKKYNWVKVREADSGNVAGLYDYVSFDAAVNTIYKVITQEDIYQGGGNEDNTIDDYGTSEPLYICLGNNKSNDFKSSGNYDYILPFEGIKDSVMVSSDAITFVHTLITKKPYAECKDWDIETWEHHRKHIGDYQFNFSDDDHYPQKYKIPLDEIGDDECYVVVAHFANGDTVRSKVFQK